MINRRLNDDAVAGLGEHVQHHAYAFHYSGDVLYPLVVHFPAVVALNPVGNARHIVVGHGGIAKHGVLHALVEGVDNEWWRSKIHVSHPQCSQIAAAVALLQRVGFYGAGAAAVDYFIEIVGLHNCLYLFVG